MLWVLPGCRARHGSTLHLFPRHSAFSCHPLPSWLLFSPSQKTSSQGKAGQGAEKAAAPPQPLPVRTLWELEHLLSGFSSNPLCEWIKGTGTKVLWMESGKRQRLLFQHGNRSQECCACCLLHFPEKHNLVTFAAKPTLGIFDRRIRLKSGMLGEEAGRALGWRGARTCSARGETRARRDGKSFPDTWRCSDPLGCAGGRGCEP